MLRDDQLCFLSKENFNSIYMTDYLDRFWSNYKDTYHIFTMNWFIRLEERSQYSHES